MLTIPQIVSEQTSPVDVVEYIMRHLLDQKDRAFHRGSCLYRATDGKTCAVGCLIPEEMPVNGVNSMPFTMAVERLFPSQIVTGLMTPFPGSRANYMAYLTIMQRMHDNLPEGKEFSIQHFRNVIDEYTDGTNPAVVSGDELAAVFNAALARLS